MKIVSDTKEISDGFKIKHQWVKKLVEKYQDFFKEYGELSLVKKESGGKPIQAYELNDAQATLLCLLLGNSEKVVEFKSKVVRELKI